MVLINEYKQIYYVLASIQNNKDRDKEDGKQNNKEAGGQKTKNKSASAGEEEKMKHELMSGMWEDIEKGIDHLFKLTNGLQRDLLCYYFGDETTGILSIKKDKLKGKL